MSDVREIPDELMDEAWQEVGALTETRGRREIHRLFREQEALFSFVAEATADLSEGAHGLALYMATVIYRAYEKAFPEGLAQASADQVFDAQEANETWLEETAGAHERIVDERILPNLVIPQPAVLRYVGECLFEPDDEEMEVPEEEQGLVFLAMKTFVEVLDQCAAGAASVPRPTPRPDRRGGRSVAPPPLYQLKVTLRGIRPPVWRRLQVRGDVTLNRLHHVLQVVMGWTDSHLHQFRVRGKIYGVPDPEGPHRGPPTLDERRVRLATVAPAEKSRIIYEYDFGDGWEHDVVVEKILPPDANAEAAVCLTGRRACPPEDCGGPWGYENLLRVVADPRDPEHEEMLAWLGGGWDPEEFDAGEVNELLRDA
jgi:hypothetical protein